MRKDFKMSNPNPGFYNACVWQHQLLLAEHDLFTEQNLLYFAGLRVLSTDLIVIHEVLLRGLIFEWLYYQLSFRLLAIKDFESSVYNDIFLQIWQPI